MASAATAPITVQETSQQTAQSSKVGPITLTHDQIAQRAHMIWEREGKVGGRDEEHWSQALAELTCGTGDVGDNRDNEEEHSCGTPQTVRTPLVTSTARRSHYSV